MSTLVTGSAGFIGNALIRSLLAQGETVIGIDNLNDYYDVGLKKARLALIEDHPAYTDARMDLADGDAMARLFDRERPTRVVNLAAQAGVRYSLENPHTYGQSNLVGFLNLLEGCRATEVKHLVFASSSSVYGTNTKLPYSVNDPTDHPISLYAATKKAGEMMAHSYSHLYGIPMTGLRFFTVYGPWGRPDMAPIKFARAILAGQPIDVYNDGDMSRDFTYIDNIIDGVIRVLDHQPEAVSHTPGQVTEPSTSHTAPYRIYNIGNSEPVQLMDFIAALELSLGQPAIRNFMPMQPGDVKDTWADVKSLNRDVGYRPSTSVADGVDRFARWYREYYGPAS
ncbi:MAG TPA: NAD-dependent epimerase [Rhodospirillales bacterium]|nr:NAD-dependent epimerase [Rhodospirillales bacterium]